MGDIKNIFLTGATGYLGSELLKAMVAEGYSVTVLKRSSSKLHRIAKVLDKITLLDVESTDIHKQFKENQYDAVVHTAASYGRSGDSIIDVLTPNLILPMKVLEASIANGVRYFINTDTALPREINSYALSKKQFLDWLLFNKNTINVINIELQYFFGSGDDDWKFINSIIRKFLVKAPFIDFTTAEQERDFIYIDDAVAAYMLLLNKSGTLTNFTNVELGSGNAVRLKDIIVSLQDLLDAAETKLNFGAIPIRSNEVMFSQANTSVLNELGWKPSNTLREGLIKTIEIEKYNHASTER